MSSGEVVPPIPPPSSPVRGRLIDTAAPLTPEQARAMPGAFTAYRRTDGELIMGEYGWATADYECMDMEGHWEGDDANEIEEVVMVPVVVRTFMCHEMKVEDEDG